MNQRNLTRLVAIVCILAAFPIAFLTLPWFPSTVIDFVQLLRAPVPTWASENFLTWREAQLHHLEIALTLYALGFLVLAGLVAVAAKLLPIWAELLLWVVTAATAISISAFWRPSISPTTDQTFAFIVIRLPVVIAAIAGFAIIVNLAGIVVRFPIKSGD